MKVDLNKKDKTPKTEKHEHTSYAEWAWQKQTNNFLMLKVKVPRLIMNVATIRN